MQDKSSRDLRINERGRAGRGVRRSKRRLESLFFAHQGSHSLPNPLRTHIPDTLSPPFPVRGVVADHGLAVREDRYIAGAQTAQAHEPLTHPILVAANVTNPDKEALADLIGPSLRRCGITRRGAG